MADSDLISTLKNLKTRLNDLEINYEDKVLTNERREKTNEILEKKLADLEQMQGDSVSVNSGGKLFTISKTNVFGCIFDNILKDELSLQTSNNEQKVPIHNNHLGGINFEEKSINEKPYTCFIDLDKKSFKLMMNIIRFLNTKYFNPDKKYVIFVKPDMDETLIRSEIMYFFKNNEKVFECLEFINF
jgi:hypothetical protein